MGSAIFSFNALDVFYANYNKTRQQNKDYFFLCLFLRKRFLRL